MLRRGPIKRSEVNRRLCVVGLGFGKSQQKATPPPPPPPLLLTNCFMVKVVRILPAQLQDNIERFNFLCQLGLDRVRANQLLRISFSSHGVDQDMRSIMQRPECICSEDQKAAVLKEVFDLLEPTKTQISDDSSQLIILNGDWSPEVNQNGLTQQPTKSEDVLCV